MTWNLDMFSWNICLATGKNNAGIPVIREWNASNATIPFNMILPIYIRLVTILERLMKKFMDKIVGWVDDLIFYDIDRSHALERYDRSTSILITVLALLLLVPLNIQLSVLKALLLIFILFLAFINMHHSLTNKFNETTINYNKSALAFSALSLFVFIVKILVLLSIALI